MSSSGLESFHFDHALDPTLQATSVAMIAPIDSSTIGIVTKLEDEGAPAVGNVVRSACLIAGAEACKAECQLTAALRGLPLSGAAEFTGSEIIRNSDDHDDCADRNLYGAIKDLGVAPEQAVILSVGQNDAIAHVDNHLDELVQPLTRWHELRNRNTIMAHRRQQVGSNALRMLGIRIGDSGVVLYSSPSSFGISHTTRTNMMGMKHLKEYEGTRRTYSDYVLEDFLEYSGDDPSEVTIRLLTAVGPEAWRKRYPNLHTLESNLPGWAEDGLIVNRTNPVWQPGMSVRIDDVLWPQYPTLIKRDVRAAAKKYGVTKLQLDGELDPGNPPQGVLHSSQAAINRGDPGTTPAGKSRDLAAIIVS